MGVCMCVCVCQVAHCYPDIVAGLPHDLITLLHQQGPLLDADMRMACRLVRVLVRLCECIPFCEKAKVCRTP